MEPTTIAAVGVGLAALLAGARRTEADDEAIVAPPAPVPRAEMVASAVTQRQAQVFGGLDPARVASAIATRDGKERLEDAVRAATARLPNPTPAQREAIERFATFIDTGKVGPVAGVRPIFGVPRAVLRAWEGLDDRTRRTPLLRPYSSPQVLIDRQTIAIASWYLSIIERKPIDCAATYAPNAPNVIAARLAGVDTSNLRSSMQTAIGKMDMRLSLNELRDLDAIGALRLAGGILGVGCGIAAIVLGILSAGAAAGVVAAACSAAGAALGAGSAAASGDVGGTVQGARDLVVASGDLAIQSGRTI